MSHTGASEPGPARGRHRFAVAAVGTLVGLAAIRFWPLLRPWDRVHDGGDLSLGIEGQFYGLLKRGIVYLWDPTMVSGNLTMGVGLVLWRAWRHRAPSASPPSGP